MRGGPLGGVEPEGKRPPSAAGGGVAHGAARRAPRHALALALPARLERRAGPRGIHIGRAGAASAAGASRPRGQSAKKDRSGLHANYPPELAHPPHAEPHLKDLPLGAEEVSFGKFRGWTFTDFAASSEYRWYGEYVIGCARNTDHPLSSVGDYRLAWFLIDLIHEGEC